MGRKNVWDGVSGWVFCVRLVNFPKPNPCTLTRRSFGSGNINLLAIFPFLGKTQLQVLSFLTSVVLMATHGLTAYSVKERVLLRDK